MATKIDYDGNIHVYPRTDTSDPFTTDEKGVSRPKYTSKERWLLKLGAYALDPGTFGERKMEVSILKETEKARQVRVVEKDFDKEGDLEKNTWIPKSICEISEYGIEIEPWFAEKERIADYCEVQVIRYFEK